MPSIRLPHPLEMHTGGLSEVSVTGATVSDAMRDLVRRHPALAEIFFDSYTDELHGFITLYLNDEDIRFRQGLDTPVTSGDCILIIPIVAGG